MWKSLWVQTPREKRGMLDGINLFFGALLGANLGTLNGLSALDYAHIIVLLAGTVVTLRIFSTTERRIHAYILLTLYVLFIGHRLFIDYEDLQGLTTADRDRLAITLLIWLVSVVLAELTPITKRHGGEAAVKPVAERQPEA